MNRVDLIGRLTRDLEVRRTSNGNSMCRFTIAVDRRFKTPGQPEADFIGCVAFGKTADNMGRFLHKGSLIAVEGRIQTGSYVNAQGQKVYTTDVIADSVQFLEPKRSQGGYGQDQGGYGYNDGGYQDNGYSGGGYSQQNSGYGYGSSAQNSYAKSVDSGFGNPSYQNANSGFGGAPANDSSDGIIDDSQTLDISSDDLPF